MKDNRSNKYKKLWVSNNFHRMMKLTASQKGKSIFEYSEELAKRNEEENKKNEFKLGF